MIVLDASAMVEWLLDTPTGGRVGDRILARRETLHAPHLLDVEVAQALRRCVAANILSAIRGGEALRDLAELPFARYPHDPLLPRVWELRESLTAYDAVYIALAEALGAPLITCDSKLRSATGHRASVEVI